MALGVAFCYSLRRSCEMKAPLRSRQLFSQIVITIAVTLTASAGGASPHPVLSQYLSNDYDA